jgi:hypothetical protein
MRFRTLWHDWVPVIMVCCSIVASIAGGSAFIAKDHERIVNRLDVLEGGQKELKDGQTELKEGQRIQGFQLETLGLDQQKVLFKLNIPSVSPDYHLYPEMGGRKQEPSQEDTLGTSKDGHSFYAAPQPATARNTAPQDAQIQRIEP